MTSQSHGCTTPSASGSAVMPAAPRGHGGGKRYASGGILQGERSGRTCPQAGPSAIAVSVAAPPERKLGRWMAVSLVVGNMIGSGAFLLPATLAPLGWASVGGWLLTITGAVCLAAVFCWLVRAMPHGCGPYVYTLRAFGPLVAFMVSWSYWISLWI